MQDAALEPFRPQRREGRLLLVLALIWGGSFLFIAIALTEIPPFTLALLRIVIAACCLWSLLLITGDAARMRQYSWRNFFVMGALNNVLPFVLIAWSQQHIAAGLAAILVATTPLIGLVLAAAWLPDEPVTRSKVLGTTAGLIGVTLIIGQTGLPGSEPKSAAVAACLLGAASFALSGIFGRRFGRVGISPLCGATGQVSAAACMLGPVALLVERPWTLPPPGWGTWAAVMALGVVSTAVAYVIYFRILAIAGSTNLLLVNLLVPVPAVVFGAIWLGQSLSAMHFAGFALIAIGLLAVDGRLWRRAFA